MKSKMLIINSASSQSVAFPTFLPAAACFVRRGEHRAANARFNGAKFEWQMNIQRPVLIGSLQSRRQRGAPNESRSRAFSELLICRMCLFCVSFSRDLQSRSKTRAKAIDSRWDGANAKKCHFAYLRSRPHSFSFAFWLPRRAAYQLPFDVALIYIKRFRCKTLPAFTLPLLRCRETHK